MNLTTRYLGMTLKHPIVASASPLSHTLDGIKLLEDSGAAAIVMYSLFEEQMGQRLKLAYKYVAHPDREDFAEIARAFPNPDDYATQPEAYVEQIHAAKEAVGIPIIGSLNVTSVGDWLEYARWIEQAGANALELNVYYVPAQTRATCAQVEQRLLDVLTEAKKKVHLPIAMKLTPYLSAPADVARNLAERGADGLVLFNRFYQPDIDLDVMQVLPRISLSTSHELRLPLHWVSALYKRIRADLAISSGVHTHEDVLKGLMAGANVTMMASALLKHGPSHIKKVLREVNRWLDQRGYDDLAVLQGCMSQMDVSLPEAAERAGYIKSLNSWHV
jgi:dihydroorotate dehydrogenase (fumarate)